MVGFHLHDQWEFEMAKCKCGSEVFRVSKQVVWLDNDDYQTVKFIVCNNDQCLEIIGVLPEKPSKRKDGKSLRKKEPQAPVAQPAKQKGGIMKGVDLAKKPEPRVTSKPLPKSKPTRAVPAKGNLTPGTGTITPPVLPTGNANVGHANVSTTTSSLVEKRKKK